MEEGMRIGTIKVETDSEEDVSGMESDGDCEPQECKPEGGFHTVTVDGGANIEEEDCVKIKSEEEDVQSVGTVKSEQEDSVSSVEGEAGYSSETCITGDVDGAEEVSINVEVEIDIKDEILDVSVPSVKIEHEDTPNELHVHSAECRYFCATYRRDRPYTCEVCNKAFSQKCNLVSHQRVHSGVRPYVCEVCKRSYCVKSCLIRHQRIHSGERPYVCEVCKKAFIDHSHLITHQRIHSGERPCICRVCNKSFSRQSHLIIHQRIHSGDRPYRCGVCNKSFSDKSRLIKHQRIHSGERPYRCEICNKAYSAKSSLTRHQHTHIGQ